MAELRALGGGGADGGGRHHRHRHPLCLLRQASQAGAPRELGPSAAPRARRLAAAVVALVAGPHSPHLRRRSSAGTSLAA